MATLCFNLRLVSKYYLTFFDIMKRIVRPKGALGFISTALLITTITLSTSTTNIYAQCPPQVNAGSDITVPCGGSAQLGEETTITNPPDFTLAPTCQKTVSSQNGPLTQGGGIYNNGVTTTGGTTNINNTSTLVDVTHTDPMGPNAWQTLWYSDYSNLFVEVCPGNSFNIQIKAKSLYSNSPYFCQIWVDWNNDGQFTASEVAHNSGPYSTNNFTVNGTITVPAGQQDGMFRMRIRFKDNAPFVPTDSADGCKFQNPQGIPPGYAGYTGSNYGNYYFSDEVEDYAVKVNCGTTTSNNGYTFSWSPPDGLDSTTIPDPTATPSQTTTYTVTVTDTVNGCSGTAQVTVTVPEVTPTFDPIPAFCSGTTPPTLPTTSTNNITGTWSPATISNTASGSYTFTPTGGQCAISVPISVTVNPNPTVSVTNAAYCANASSTLTASGANTYAWSPSAGLSATTGATVTTTATASTTYTVTGTDANGCTNTATATVTVNPNPTYTSTTTNPTCGNSDGEIVLTANGGTAPYDYSVNTTTQTNGTFPNLPDGSYNITISDDNGCSTTGSISLTNSSADDPSFTVTNFCQGATNSASAIATPGGTFSFNPAATDGATINATTGEITNGVGGTTYTVQYSISGACPTTSTKPVTVHPLPTYTENNTDPSCGNSDGQIIVIATGGLPPYSYTLDETTQDNGTFSDLSQGTYLVDIVDGYNCTANANPTLTDSAPADPAFTVTDFCEGTTNTASNIATPGGTFNFNPAVTDGATINATTGEITNGVGGTTYTVEYHIPGSCPNSSTQPVTVLANPTFTLTPSNPSCGNSDGSITLSGLNPTTGYTFAYTKNGAVVGPTNVTSNAAGEIVLSNLGIGNYSNFSVTISAGGCSTIDATLIQLIEPGAPTISAPNDIIICIGDSITLTANNPDNVNVYWNNGVTDGVTFAPSGSGIFIVTATLNGCTTSDQVQVTVNPLPTINAGQDVTICANSSTTLVASGGATYNWDNGLGTGASQTVSPTATTTYEVTGTNSNGCVNTDQVTVNVAPIPSLNIDGINLKGCAPVIPTLTNTLAGNSDNCKWILEDGRVINGCGPISPIFNSEGCYDVTLVVTSANGCTNSQTIQDYICVYPQPEASFYPKPAILEAYPWEAEMVNNSSNATNYTWTFGDETPTSNEENPSHVYPGEISGGYTIMLVASNDAGCVDTTYGYVRVREELIFYVPNTFTPDGDQFNNTFFPVFTSGYDIYNYELLIFNRWGELIFESHNTEIGWDGTYKGALVQDGTYTWKIKVKVKDYDEYKQFVGHVNMIR